MSAPVNAAILGLEGLTLTDWEQAFFKELNPLGFILFARNVDRPDQVKALCASLRELTGRDDTPILIDQEGGRVARLKPPHWPENPPMAVFGKLYEQDPESAFEACYLNARLLGQMVLDLGIDVDCAPVLDLPQGDADPIIGDRALHQWPVPAYLLGRKVVEGLLDSAVMPVIKHIPGHGRALVDSHLSLPTVPTDTETLRQHDFKPFKGLASAPWAMTAHIVYEDIDPDHTATMSKTVISEIIRGEIKFDGLLLTDDLSMKALDGSFSDRAANSLAAGCDVVLHCNGNQDEMTLVAKGLSELSGDAKRRFDHARTLLQNKPFDADAAREKLAGVLKDFVRY